MHFGEENVDLLVSQVQLRHLKATENLSPNTQEVINQQTHIAQPFARIFASLIPLDCFDAKLSPKRSWRGPRSRELGGRGLPDATFSQNDCRAFTWPAVGV